MCACMMSSKRIEQYQIKDERKTKKTPKKTKHQSHIRSHKTEIYDQASNWTKIKPYRYLVIIVSEFIN